MNPFHVPPPDTSSLYIHIPYCRSKCLYCDFFSGGHSIARWDDYSSQLIAELKLRRDELPGKIVSIYFGGGTPSLIPPETFAVLTERLLAILGDSVTADAEFTLEANPEDITRANIALWKKSGVNRISLGIQSFSDDILYRLGRKHDSSSSRKALRLLSENFKNFSGDLIFGLPGQSLDHFKSDVDQLTASGVSHISCYSLMFEKGTALYELQRLGKLEEAPEELSAEMYAYLTTRLNSEGFIHYEISNFALPGYESRHNSGYWTGRSYLGLGPSAHSYDGCRVRRANPWRLKEYLNHNFSETHDAAAFYEEEYLTENELREEYIMLRLRTLHGIDISDYRKRFGQENLQNLIRMSQSYVASGHMEYKNDNLRLSDSGILISDTIISSFF